MNREYAIDRLIENYDKCVNMLDLCHRLGIENVGGEDYKEVRALAKELGLELRFSYKRMTKSYREKIPMDDILVEHSLYTNKSRLKKRLIECGLKENKCENPQCGICEWNGKPISLQLHHINGIHDDNRIENLMLLCPNCHSQTDTYAGKNSNKYESTTKTIVKKRHTNKEDWIEARECAWERNHPSKETLINLFLVKRSFLQVGKSFGVSDNAIRKWFKHYGLPFDKKGLMEYIQTLGRAVEGTGLQNQQD